VSAEEPAFLRARDEWDNRWSRAAQRERNWQVMALLCFLFSGLEGGVIAVLASQSKITPYVVAVDKLGQPYTFGPAEQLGQVDERLYRYLLALFIYNVRAIVADPEAQKVLATRAYEYAARDAARFLTAHYQKDNPFERAKRETVTVVVTSALKLSRNSWQVDWTEHHTSLSSIGEADEHWRAVLHVALNPPTTAEAILTNPIGLFVVDMTWTKILS